MVLEERMVNAVLYDAMALSRETLSRMIVNLFQERGIDALAVGKDTEPCIPSIVVSVDSHYALIYLMVENNDRKEAQERFQREAEWYAKSHDASAYFVRVGTDVIPRGTD